MAIPSDLSGLRLWLKADAIVGADNDQVATWADSSGNAFDVTQGTAGKRPLYKTGISPTGLPVVRFDGIDDDLDGTTWANLWNVTGGVCTVLAAVYITSSGTGVNSWLQPAVIADTAGYFGMHIYDASGTPWFRAFNYDTTEDFAEVAMGYNAWTYLGIDHDNTTVNAFTGTMAANVANVLSGAPGGGANVRLGQSSGVFLGGDFGEICVWNRVLTGTERQDMAAYLTRWTLSSFAVPAFVARVPLVGGMSFAPGLRGPGTDKLGDMR